LLLGAMTSPLAAQTLADAALRAATRHGVPPAPTASQPASDTPREDGLDARAAPSLSRLSVIELPLENGALRHHHALSVPFDGARAAVRLFGVEASECALQFRLPSRLLRAPVAGASTTLDVQAQVRLACTM
jgi:hypothetical protein